MQPRIAFSMAAILLVAGVVLMTWRDAGVEHEEAGDGAVETSGETQPYFWHGVAVFVAGLALGGWSYRRHRARPRG